MRKKQVPARLAVAIPLLLCGGLAAWARNDEPGIPEHSKLLLENDRVRVMEVTTPPGATQAMHSHPGHVVYVLGPNKARLTTAEGMARESESKAGDVRWNEPVTHQVENIGTTPIHLIVVELKEGQK